MLCIWSICYEKSFPCLFLIFLSTHSNFNLFFDTCSKVLYFLSVFFFTLLLGTLGHIWRSNKTVLLYPWWSYSGCKEIINISLFCCCFSFLGFYLMWDFSDVNMLINYTLKFFVNTVIVFTLLNGKCL